jgi:uncharacterized delta-60 repeat protein
MGFIRDNTNSFEVYLTDLGKQKFFEDGFKDSISYFSISDTDSNYTIFNPALNEIIPFEKMSEINVGDVVSYINVLKKAGDKNDQFNLTNISFNNRINTIVTQPDGKLLVGGAFSQSLYEYIIRITTSGTIDNTFNTGNTKFNNIVSEITLQPDGKILVGGNFTEYSGVAANKIIRLDTGGTIDNTFNIGTGFVNGQVLSMALQPDGKILVGGSFSTYSGVTRNRIIRLNTGGTIDNTFNIGDGFNGDYVNEITLQPDGKILVGGRFTTYSGVTSNYIIRLNTGGTIDNTFNIGDGFNSDTDVIKLQPDGKILVGGAFTTYGGVTSNGLIRLNTGGTIDNTFNLDDKILSNFVTSLTLQPDGKILVGSLGTGIFYNNKFITRRFFRLNTDGTIDNSFDIDGDSFNNTVTISELDVNNNILVAGAFTTYKGISANRIIKLNNNLDLINTQIKYYRNIKKFNNLNQVPSFISPYLINSEYWEETNPFDSTNINPQPIQILNHNNTKKTTLPLNLSKENNYLINRTITTTSLSC